MEENWIAIPFDVENIREKASIRFRKKIKSLLKYLCIRCFDILVAIMGLIVLLPFSLIVMLKNFKNRDYKNIFKTEDRMGKNGKIFKMFRFRATEGSEFESFLVSTSLDELPQFINLLIGNMALIGPRPYTSEEKEKMGTYYSRISQMKPGLTGVYQISGKTKMSFLDRLDMDTRYYYNKNIWTDTKILLITFLITLRNKKTLSIVDCTYTTIKEALSVILKRVIDILGAIAGIAILIPLTIVVTISNYISGDFGPIFYSQERIGKYGKHFKMYKFRSMVVGADKKLEELLAKDEKARKEYQKYKKLKKDPRITKIGSFLRKTSLDEFPQFINVLKGEMSLVGPRPYLPIEKKDMTGYYEHIITVKPGVTGLWQISGRSDVDFKERLDLDMEYCVKSNIYYDISILLKTIRKVVKKEGAE